MSKVLVVGASGTVGTELVKKLRAKGHVVVRATSKKETQADQVHLDLVARTGLEQAFKGVEKLFLLSPPGHTNQNELLAPLIEKAKELKLKKVALMTAMGANAVEESPMRQAELHLEKSGLSWNVIRPNWFMQNFNTFWVHGVKQADTLALPVGQAKTSFIDARDIAAVAAELLDNDKFNNQEFDLTGADSITHTQAAEIMSQATGKKIKFADITSEAMLEILLNAGLPKAYSEFLVVILGFLKQGYAERVTDSVHKITGEKPISFEQYARDYKQAWI